MKLFSTIKEKLFSIFQTALIVLLVVLIAVFVGVLSFEYVEKHTSKLLDLPSKNETLKFLGIGMGGVLVALQALMSYRRAKAMEKTSEAQADAARAQADAVSKTEQGQRQDRLKNAIEHLGHDKDSVRLGGAYELFHLAKDTLEEDAKEKLSQTVLDILCAHIRQTTGESKYRETHKSEPSEEIQSLLTLLFVQEHEAFKGCHINLQGSWLNGADLRGARLAKAVLNLTYMQGAILTKAHLQGAFLHWAQLQGAFLGNAQLQGANLTEARLQTALLPGAHLQGAILTEARLQGALLLEARLQGAILTEAHLQGAILTKAHLQGANSEKLFLSVSFEDRIRSQIGKKSNLSEAIFEGGLSQEDVKSLVGGLADYQANRLQEILKPHIGKPKSNQLPQDSGAITGSYTKEEAEQWIAEYKKAMSEAPGDDS